MDKVEPLAIVVVGAAFFIGMTLLTVDVIDGEAEKSAIEQGYIILQGDKYRLERVE